MGVEILAQERKDQDKFLDDLFENNSSLRSCFRSVNSGKYYSVFAKRAKKLCGEGLREGIAKFKGPKRVLDGLYDCSFEKFCEYAALDYQVKAETSHPVLDVVAEKLRGDYRLFKLWASEESGASIIPRQISRIVYYSFVSYIKPIWEARKSKAS